MKDEIQNIVQKENFDICIGTETHKKWGLNQLTLITINL